MVQMWKECSLSIKHLFENFSHIACYYKDSEFQLKKILYLLLIWWWLAKIYWIDLIYSIKEHFWIFRNYSSPPNSFEDVTIVVDRKLVSWNVWIRIRKTLGERRPFFNEGAFFTQDSTGFNSVLLYAVMRNKFYIVLYYLLIFVIIANKHAALHLQ